VEFLNLMMNTVFNVIPAKVGIYHLEVKLYSNISELPSQEIIFFIKNS